MWIVYEYMCLNGHRVASLEDRQDPNPTRKCECGEIGERVISSPRVLTHRVVAASKAKNDNIPGNFASTRSLGEGQPYNEWRREQEERRVRLEWKRDDDERRAVRKVLDRAGD